jgi:hypothetical protein
LAWRDRVPGTYITISPLALISEARNTYHEALFLAHQNILHTLLQLLRGGLRVGNLVSAAHLLLKTLPEVTLCALVLFNLTAQVAADVLDLARHTRVAGTRGLLDALELIAQVAQSSVDLVLDVVDSLARGLVLLSGARVQKGLLGGDQLSLTLLGQLGDTLVDFLALVQDRGRASGGTLVDVGHLCQTVSAVDEVIVVSRRTITTVSLLRITGLAVATSVTIALLLVGIRIALLLASVRVVLAVAALVVVPQALVLGKVTSEKQILPVKKKFTLFNHSHS